MHRDENKAAIIAELMRQESGGALAPYVRDDGDGWYTIDGMVNVDKIVDAIVKAIGEDRP